MRFWFWRLRPEKKVPVVCLAGCAVASVFGSGDYDRKKKFHLSVWRVVLLRQFLVLAITTGKKKVPVVCLAGCVTTGKKNSSSRRQSDYDWKKKVQVVIKFELVQLELKLIQIP